MLHGGNTLFNENAIIDYPREIFLYPHILYIYRIFCYIFAFLNFKLIIDMPIDMSL